MAKAGSKEKAVKSPFDNRPVWLGAILLVAIIFLLIFIPCPTTTQYFLFRILIALSIAGLASVIPGILKLNITNGVTASGAIAIFAIIYFFDPASNIAENKCGINNFNVTVYVHGKAGPEDKILKAQGEVLMYLKSNPVKAKIDEEGRAMFTEISPLFEGQETRVSIRHAQPYQSTHPDSLYRLEKDGIIYLETELKGEDKIFGEVLDHKTGKFIDSVRVSILDLETYTNKNGWFQLLIPPGKQAKFQRVSFDKNGYEREVYDSVPVHTQRPFSVVLKSNVK